MTTTHTTTRNRITADVLDNSPVESARWWGRSVADAAELLEARANVADDPDHRAGARRLINQLRASLDDLTRQLDRIDAEHTRTYLVTVTGRVVATSAEEAHALISEGDWTTDDTEVQPA